MSASIYFRQVKPLEGEYVSCSWPSSFIEAMTRAFRIFPVELDEAHIPILTGLAAGCPGKENPYQELIEAIEQYKQIEVYAIY